MSEVQVRPIDMPNGVNAQDIAALGAQLAGHGLTRMQVQGLLARIQKMSEQLAITSLSEILEDVRRIHEARMWQIINFVQTLSGMGGYINRNAVISYIHSINATTPRQ